MVDKKFCDFCGEEIIPYKNDMPIDDDIKFDSKLRPGYGGEVKLSVRVCASEESFGHKQRKDICKKCFKTLVKDM